MKIILTDNFDRDYVSDRLIAENVSEYYVNIIVDALNARVPANGADYFIAVLNDYKLYEFKP